MLRKELKELEDILIAIKDIDSFLKGHRMFEYYQSNKMLRQAIERNFEIIGEATNRLRKRNPLIKISNVKE